MKKFNSKFTFNKALTEKVYFYRQQALKRKRRFSKEQLNKPIAFWTKKERLLDGPGKEFTIILRTRGCEWALGDHGGCSMCGYINDANIENVPPPQIKKQFDYALSNKINEINTDNYNYILKLFNSGSFLDEGEITKTVRKYIYEKIAGIEKIKEVVLESRVEYITKDKLSEIKQSLKNIHLEIAIGLETIDDYIRNNYINKGLLFRDFKNAIEICRDSNVGVKVYLLFKPPFVNEQGAIDDCENSIKQLIKLKVNTISINPLNVQKGTFTEFLWFQKRYRPPWYYSLFKCLKRSLNQEDLKSVRILSDPSGAGTKRGIHNCLKRECESSAKETLRKFVLTQDLMELDKEIFECNCKTKYKMQKSYY